MLKNKVKNSNKTFVDVKVILKTRKPSDFIIQEIPNIKVVK